MIFHLLDDDYPSELKGWQAILAEIMRLAEPLEVSFAFPTRTLLIEGASGEGATDLGGTVVPFGR